MHDDRGISELGWPSESPSWILRRRVARLDSVQHMANHKRRRPKQRRAGCLLCKPQKLPSLKKAERRRGRRDAFAHELRANTRTSLKG